MYFGLKKEGNSGICYSVGEPLRHYAKQNKPVIKGQILLYSIYIRYLESSKLWRQKVEECRLPGAAEEENEDPVLNEYRVPVLNDEKVLEQCEYT